METKDSIQLTVQELYPRDIGRGVARIDYDSMNALNASTGDVIEIKGKKRTVAKYLPPYPSDERKGIIRIDGLTCINSGVEIGDTITVRKIKAVDAEIVVVYSLEATQIDECYLTEALEKNLLIKGNYVMVPYFGCSLPFEVIWARPEADVVLVTHKTVFHIATESEVELKKDGNEDYGKKMKPSGLKIDLNKLV